MENFVSLAGNIVRFRRGGWQPYLLGLVLTHKDYGYESKNNGPRGRCRILTLDGDLIWLHDNSISKRKDLIKVTK